MQTEINGTFHSMKNSSLKFRKLTNRNAFSEIYEFKGRFPFDQIEIPVSISGNFHGRMVQKNEKRQAEQLCSLGIFQ